MLVTIGKDNTDYAGYYRERTIIQIMLVTMGKGQYRLCWLLWGKDNTD